MKSLVKWFFGKKEAGKAEIIGGMLFLSFLILMLAVHLQLRIFYTVSFFMEDALAASNLASIVIDIEEYGISHILKISAPEVSYEIYKEALKMNLQIGADWESGQKNLISGKVEIQQYCIYNVLENDVEVYYFGGEGSGSYYIANGLGTVKTPDGTLIESTSVYSRIGFPVTGILGVEVYAVKENSVDVVSNVAE